MTENRGHEGGCLCGSIRYRITGQPVVLSLCHCRSCRLASGGPTLAWTVVRLSNFTLLSGKLTRFRSSPSVVRTFCCSCGTALTYQRDSWPNTIDVTTATLDEPDEFAPAKEIWVDHKLSWEPLIDAIPHFPGSSVA
ncbi:MAG: GFA family protein [Woeseiaceae bacterium]